MGKSSDVLIKKLAAKIESGELTKADVKRSTGFSSSLLETYLSGDSVPGMDAMDRIATALGSDAWKLLAPENPGSLIPDFKRKFIQEILELDDSTAGILIPSFRTLMAGVQKRLEGDDPGEGIK